MGPRTGMTTLMLSGTLTCIPDTLGSNSGETTGYQPGVFLDWPVYSNTFSFELRHSGKELSHVTCEESVNWVAMLIYLLRHSRTACHY